MGTISVTIQKRTYRLTCGDGEEARLKELVEHIRAKADQLTADHGRISEQHLLLMSAILITDELFDLRVAADDREERAGPKRKSRTSGEKSDGAEAKVDDDAGSKSSSAARLPAARAGRA